MTSEKDSIPTVNELFDWKPSEVQSWLDSVLSNREKRPEEFNWLLLAEHSAQLARWSDDLEWARLSTRVYDWLHSMDPHHNDSSMTLRAYFIKRLGSISGDPLLDSNVILKWFYDNLTMSFTEAQLGITTCKRAIASGNIQPDDRQLCGQLRQIKNKLSIIALIADSDTVSLDEDLKRWLEIRTSLP